MRRPFGVVLSCVVVSSDRLITGSVEGLWATQLCSVISKLYCFGKTDVIRLNLILLTPALINDSKTIHWSNRIYEDDLPYGLISESSRP